MGTRWLTQHSTSPLEPQAYDITEVEEDGQKNHLDGTLGLVEKQTN
jgi:hypothetical protein